MRQLTRHASDRRESVLAILAMVVEELIAIDDIGPWDVYGDQYERNAAPGAV